MKFVVHEIDLLKRNKEIKTKRE